MVFLLTVVLMATTWISAPLRQVTPVEHKAQPHNQTNSAAQQPSANGQTRPEHDGTTVVKYSRATRTADDTESHKKPPEPQPHTYWPRSEWVMVSLTFIYVVVSCFSFWAIKRQADIAAGIVSIERPWVIATLKPPRISQVLIGNALIPVAQIVCRLKNYGRTPAWIISFGVKRHNIFQIDALPPEPKYDEEKQIGGEASLPPGRYIDQLLEMSPDHFSEADAGKLFIFVYGFIIYRDVFSQDRRHETRFCFRYQPPQTPTVPGGFYVGGPPAYNIQT